MTFYGFYRTFLHILLVTGTVSIPFYASAQNGLAFIQGGAFAQGPGWQATQVLSRIRNAASSSLQGGTKKKMREREVKINLLPPEGKEPFNIKEVFGGYEITVPSGNGGWLRDPRNTDSVARTCFAAGIGLREEKRNKLPDCWLFSAAVYRGLASETGALPAVRACASRGIVPDLELILRSPASAEDGACRYFCGEWSFLLFELCRRHGVFRTGAVSNFLLDLANHPQTDQAQLFRKHIYPVILHRIRHGKQKGPDMNEWFRSAALSCACDIFHPMSPENLEVRFQEIIAPDNAPSVYKLAGGKDKLTPEQSVMLARMMMDLTRLRTAAPAGCGLRLAAFVSDIDRMRMLGPSQEMLDQLRSSGASLEKELAFISAVNFRLKRAEQKFVPPGWRCAMLFDALKTENSMKTSLQNRAERMLDRYER